MRPSASVAPSATTSPSRSSSTRTPSAGRPAAVSSTCVDTVVTAARSLREPDRLDAVLLRDLALVGAHEVPVADDLFAGDVEAVDAVRPREDEVRDEVRRAARLEAGTRPDG